MTAKELKAMNLEGFKIKNLKNDKLFTITDWSHEELAAIQDEAGNEKFLKKNNNSIFRKDTWQIIIEEPTEMPQIEEIETIEEQIQENEKSSLNEPKTMKKRSKLILKATHIDSKETHIGTPDELSDILGGHRHTIYSRYQNPRFAHNRIYKKVWLLEKFEA